MQKILFTIAWRPLSINSELIIDLEFINRNNKKGGVINPPFSFKLINQTSTLNSKSRWREFKYAQALAELAGLNIR